MVRDLKYPTIGFNASRPTALSAEDEKYPIMVFIQTEDIKQFVKKRSTLWQSIINLYRLIWGQCSPALQRLLEGYPEYITNSPIYSYLWLFTKVNMCESRIKHTSNGYYSLGMATRTVFSLRQGRDEPTEAYYRLFEAAISTAELEK